MTREEFRKLIERDLVDERELVRIAVHPSNDERTNEVHLEVRDYFRARRPEPVQWHKTRYESPEAVDFWNRRLGVKPDSFSQDWDIEVARVDMLEPLLEWSEQPWPEEELVALGSLFIAVMDARLRESFEIPQSQVEQFCRFLFLNAHLCVERIDYWAKREEVSSYNSFAVTGLVREVQDAL